MSHPDDPRRNPNVRITGLDVLSDNWYVLRKVTFEYDDRAGGTTVQHREVYDRGNGATILLHDPVRDTVLLTRQFRMPVYLNGHPDGMLIETPAGLLDGDAPEECIRREAEEETGFRASGVRKVFELFMSPGAVTEWVALFVGTYDESSHVSAGGGIEHEGEDIHVVELPLSEALAMVERGEINDAKTVILLQWMQLQRSAAA
jgi:nudix-type nucleoside diphosphatase (YffH/AdpP family)